MTDVLMMSLPRKIAGSSHLRQQLQNADVGNQDASHAEVDCPRDVQQRIAQLVRAAKAQSESFAGSGECLRACVECGSGADEQIDLNALLPPDDAHLRNFLIGHQHDAAALANAMDRNTAFLRLSNDSAQHGRTFGAGYLQAVLPAVREALC